MRKLINFIDRQRITNGDEVTNSLRQAQDNKYKYMKYDCLRAGIVSLHVRKSSSPFLFIGEMELSGRRHAFIDPHFSSGRESSQIRSSRRGLLFDCSIPGRRGRARALRRIGKCCWT